MKRERRPRRSGSTSGRTKSRILSVKEVAAELGVTEKTVYEHAAIWPFMFKLPGSRLWFAHLDRLRAYARTTNGKT